MLEKYNDSNVLNLFNTMLDNGKIRISIADGIPLIEVYHNGELELGDVEWAKHVILHELPATLTMPVDIIVDRKGNYSLSIEALAHMEALMKEANHVAYVVYSQSQELIVNLASSLYLTEKKVKKFHSVSEAFAWLKANK